MRFQEARGYFYIWHARELYHVGYSWRRKVPVREQKAQLCLRAVFLELSPPVGLADSSKGYTMGYSVRGKG